MNEQTDGYVSEGLPGTDGLTSTVSFEMYKQEKGGGSRGEEKRQVICGKEDYVY